MCDLCEDRKETGMEESRKCVKIEMDTSELDDVLKKVEKLREKAEAEAYERRMAAQKGSSNNET